MNAIEMAMSAALKRTMDGLVERIPELIENLPPDIKAILDLIGKSVACYQAQLDRIEERQRLIMAHLGIEGIREKTEISDGRSDNGKPIIPN